MFHNVYLPVVGAVVGIYPIGNNYFFSVTAQERSPSPPEDAASSSEILSQSVPKTLFFPSNDGITRNVTGAMLVHLRTNTGRSTTVPTDQGFFSP